MRNQEPPFAAVAPPRQETSNMVPVRLKKSCRGFINLGEVFLNIWRSPDCGYSATVGNINQYCGYNHKPSPKPSLHKWYVYHSQSWLVNMAWFYPHYTYYHSISTVNYHLLRVYTIYLWWFTHPTITLQSPCGGVLKSGYPQIIHFNGIFHYKPSILGYPPFMETRRI